ncbi:hypothetical protein VTN02DRAFT_424 [Thermoascus thermophilus]
MPIPPTIKEKLEGKFKRIGDAVKRKARTRVPDSRLRKVKIEAIHLKHKIGKFQNIINPNHRHDEPHEQAADRKRTATAESHRFQSFAPEREGNRIKWYVDGRDYFWAVSVALDRAKETIYIADWWLSPELFLRRPPYFNQEWRIDQVLKSRAEAGVKIYVVVYKEVTQALTCNSAHTKHVLNGLISKGKPGHGNIQVLRHPDHNIFENAGDMTFYWAHHEKLIVIDYAIAFVGGLDLCFGRWDTHQHALADLHPSGVENEIFPGQDFNNNRIMDFKRVAEWQDNKLSKAEHGRMPWHDVAFAVIGDCVYDIAEHFVLRWNLVKRDKYKRVERIDWLMLEGRTGEDEDIVSVQRPMYPCGQYVQHPLSPLSTKPRGMQGSVRAQVVRSSSDWSSGILVEHSIQNAHAEIIRGAEHFVYIESQFFVTATGDGQSPIHNRIGRAIVDACVRADREGRKFRVIIVIPAIPGFAGDLRQDAATGTRAIMDYQYKSICRGENSIFGQIAAQGVDPRRHVFVFNLRVYDRINKTPAFVDRVMKSGVPYQTIQRAQAEQIMGEGIRPAIGKGIGRHEKNHGMKDVSRQRYIDQLRRLEAQRAQAGRQDQVTSRDTISQDAMLNGGKVTEEQWEGDPEQEKENFVQGELYVHAKVCIVDDRVVICGSANINDRSQLGSCDSELSIVMEDQALIDSAMDGKPYKARRLATALRRKLWREHLGLLPAQDVDASSDPDAQPPDDSAGDTPSLQDPEDEFVQDPLSDQLWDTWTRQATTNTEIYRFLFRADPDDSIRTWADYDSFTPRSDVARQGHLHDPASLSVSEVREKLDQIGGHLVWMPLNFLKDVNMAEPSLTVNQWTESIYA